jgi:hypothetical protein
LLDRLIARAYPQCHAGAASAPPVIFLTQSNESSAFHEIQRDARIRGAVPLPLSLDALINAASTVLPAR